MDMKNGNEQPDIPLRVFLARNPVPYRHLRSKGCSITNEPGVKRRRHQGSQEGRKLSARAHRLLERSRQDTGTYEDNALLARLLDPNTDRFVVVAAGNCPWRHRSGRRILGHAYRRDGLARPAPKDWSHKNVEIFLETQVIDGRSGPPRIDESTLGDAQRSALRVPAFHSA
jgi:hypothetical protein